MKQIIITVGLLVLTSSFVFAQFKQNDVELQFSGNIGSLTSKSSTTGSFSSSSSNSQTFFYITACPGFYIIDGLSFEPEISVLIVEKNEPALYFLANGSYTYLVPQSKIAPFVRVGYGVSNAYRLPGLTGGLVKASKNMDVKVLNLSGGLKILVSRGASINAEINYRSHNYSTTSGSGTYSSTYDLTYSSIGLILGFSIII